MHPTATSHTTGASVHALIFDMDGTILDTRAYHMAAWRELVRRKGLTEEHYLVAENGFGKTNWAIFESWFGANPDGHDYNAISDEKEAIFRELIAGKERPRPGMLELLDWARRSGIRIALATSGPQANAEFLLADTGIDRYFDTVLWGDAQIPSKPHPEPFLRATARLDVPPRHAVVFEDSCHGFEAATRAGMRIIGIAERDQDLPMVAQWTPYVFRDFQGVPELIESWK